MRALVLALIGILPCAALAQTFNGPATVVYPTTAGHCLKVASQGGGYIADSGAACGTGTGSVSSFSSGNLLPLFTTSVATPTTTPALSFSLNSQTQGLVLASPTGASGAPTFRALAASDLPTFVSTFNTRSGAVVPASGDYSFSLLSGSATCSQLPALTGDITSSACATTAAGSLVKSISLTVPSFFISPVNFSVSSNAATGTLSLLTQSANQFFAGPSSGAAAAPTFRSLVGADLPAPTATTLGGVQSFAAVSHQWVNAISTAGAPSASQPACADLSNAAASCSTDATIASNISSGTLSASRLPAFTGDTSSSAGSSALTLTNSNTARADLGLTVVGALKTAATGAVSQAAAADLSNGVTGSGAVVLATSPSLTTPNIGAAQASTIGVGTAPAAGTGLNVSSIAQSGTNAYGLQVAAPTGATNNYAATFSGVVGVGTLTPAVASSTNNYGGTNANFQLNVSNLSSVGYTNLAVTGPTNGGAALSLNTGTSGATSAAIGFSANASLNSLDIVNYTVGGSTRFYTNNAGTVGEISRFSNAGRLLIGTTTDNGTDLLQINGSETATLYKGPTLGVTTGAAATAGNVGEAIKSCIASGSAVTLTSGTTANVTSISLTAGDWNVSGDVNQSQSAATQTAAQAGISTTSATMPNDGSEINNGTQLTLTTAVGGSAINDKQVNVSATTTAYLVTNATFSAGTIKAYGCILARRMR